VDAFQEAVEDARRQLSILEGRDVSVAELIERSGLPKSKRSAVYYHLNPNIARKRGHHVPQDIVQALSDVLLIPYEQLAGAARVSAGFQVERTDLPDIPAMVARYLGDPEVDETKRDEVAARLLDVLARNAQRRRRRSE
jgi:hypothetical protein